MKKFAIFYTLFFFISFSNFFLTQETEKKTDVEEERKDKVELEDQVEEVKKVEQVEPKKEEQKKDDQKTDNIKPIRTNQLIFTISPLKNELNLLEDFSIEATIKNDTEKEQEISVLEIETRSMRLRIDIDGLINFNYVVTRPSELTKEFIKPEKIKLPPDKSVTTIINFPAVISGKYKITGEYNGWTPTGSNTAQIIFSNPVEVTVKQDELPKVPVVKIETEYGVIEIELLPKKSPNNVTNFVKLIKNDFYTNNIFHRVTEDFIQAGCPFGIGTGGPGFSVYDEKNKDLKHKSGTVSMSKIEDVRDSAGSQFFICLKQLPHLDNEYTIIGFVVQGVDIAEKISKVTTAGKEGDKTRNLPPYKPYDNIVIKKMTLELKETRIPKEE